MIDQVKKRIFELERQPEVSEEYLGHDGDDGCSDEGRVREGEPLDEAETLLQVGFPLTKHGVIIKVEGTCYWFSTARVVKPKGNTIVLAFTTFDMTKQHVFQQDRCSGNAPPVGSL